MNAETRDNLAKLSLICNRAYAAAYERACEKRGLCKETWSVKLHEEADAEASSDALYVAACDARDVELDKLDPGWLEYSRNNRK